MLKISLIWKWAGNRKGHTNLTLVVEVMRSSVSSSSCLSLFLSVLHLPIQSAHPGLRDVALLRLVSWVVKKRQLHRFCWRRWPFFSAVPKRALGVVGWMSFTWTEAVSSDKIFAIRCSYLSLDFRSSEMHKILITGISTPNDMLEYDTFYRHRLRNSLYGLSVLDTRSKLICLLCVLICWTFLQFIW